MIKAALFDFGGVILSSPFEAFNGYEREIGIPLDFIRRLNATNSDTNAWAGFERGELDAAGFVREFEAEASAAGHDLDANRILACLRGGIRTEMVTAVRLCGERLATAMLTNNFRGPDTDEHASGWGRLRELFDHVIESSVVGVRKPEPRFYEIACESLGVEAGECVFLDDLGINLKPARAMGMTTIKVDDPVKAIAELEEVVGFSLS